MIFAYTMQVVNYELATCFFRYCYFQEKIPVAGSNEQGLMLVSIFATS